MQRDGFFSHGKIKKKRAHFFHMVKKKIGWVFLFIFI